MRSNREVGDRIVNELYHHGVKGMKWGVRRYQKNDGSLTPAGRKRYSDDSPPSSKKTSATKKSSGTKRTSTAKKTAKKKEYDQKVGRC